jgi:hypothetical protein
MGLFMSASMVYFWNYNKILMPARWLNLYKQDGNALSVIIREVTGIQKLTLKGNSVSHTKKQIRHLTLKANAVYHT